MNEHRTLADFKAISKSLNGRRAIQTDDYITRAVDCPQCNTQERAGMRHAVIWYDYERDGFIGIRCHGLRCLDHNLYRRLDALLEAM